MRLVLTLPLAALASAVYGEDLIKDAPKITNTKSYVSAASVSWASIFYQVNMNINDAKYLGKPGDYEKAVRLYGTTALPAAFVPTWPAGYLSRAQALAGSQTPTPTPTPTSTHKPTSTPSPTSTPESSEKEPSSTTEPNGAVDLQPGLAVPLAVAAAIAVVMGSPGIF